MNSHHLLASLSLLLLFAISARGDDPVTYQMHFQINGTPKHGSKPGDGKLNVSCKVGKHAAVKNPHMLTDELTVVNAAKKRGVAMRVVEKFMLESGGEAKSMSVSAETVRSVPGREIEVDEAVVECRFKSGSRNQGSGITMRVMDIQWNPRFGMKDDWNRTWKESTWILEPHGEFNSWFVKEGNPQSNGGLEYEVISWNASGLYWPSENHLNKASYWTHIPSEWKMRETQEEYESSTEDEHHAKGKRKRED